MSKNPAAVSNQLGMFAVEEAESVPLASSLLMDLWHQSFIVEGYENRLEADYARRRGEQLMTHFYQWWSAQPRKVVSIEKGFKINLDDRVITGRYDRVEEKADGIHVIDYKTSSQRDQQAVDADLQLSIYAMASAKTFEKPCVQLSLLFISEEGCVEVTTERNESQLIDAAKQINSFCDRIDSEDFRPTPTREKCRVCPYRGICDAAAVQWG